jgi:hypothetical protein
MMWYLVEHGNKFTFPFPPFTKLGMSIIVSKLVSIYPEPDETSPHILTLFVTLIVSFQLCLVKRNKFKTVSYITFACILINSDQKVVRIYFTPLQKFSKRV